MRLLALQFISQSKQKKTNSFMKVPFYDLCVYHETSYTYNYSLEIKGQKLLNTPSHHISYGDIMILLNFLFHFNNNNYNKQKIENLFTLSA